MPLPISAILSPGSRREAAMIAFLAVNTSRVSISNFATRAWGSRVGSTKSRVMSSAVADCGSGGPATCGRASSETVTASRMASPIGSATRRHLWEGG